MQIHFTLANLYSTIGNLPHALHFYHSTLALQSNFEPAKVRIASIHCSTQGELLGQWNHSMELKRKWIWKQFKIRCHWNCQMHLNRINLFFLPLIFQLCTKISSNSLLNILFPSQIFVGYFTFCMNIINLFRFPLPFSSALIPHFIIHFCIIFPLINV